MDKKTWPPGVRPSGSGIRIFIYRNQRLDYAETLPGDPYKAADLAAAVKRRRDLMARRQLGLPYVQAEYDLDLSLFADAAQDYLYSLDVKRSTAGEYVNILNRYWLPAFGGWPCREISRAAIRRELAKMPVIHKTKRNRLHPLAGVLSHVDINPNPTHKLVKGTQQKPPIDRYTPKQRARLLDKLDGEALVFFAVLFGCGLRPGEARALTWDDYDDKEFHITKNIARRRLTTTKTDTQRRVYVPSWVRSILKDHTTRFKGGPIFQKRRGGPHLDSDVFNQAWRRAHGRARIAYRKPYTCRHTRASELLSIGIEPARAAKELGHSLEIFYRTYAEYIEEYCSGLDRADFEGVANKLSKNKDKWK